MFTFSIKLLDDFAKHFNYFSYSPKIYINIKKVSVDKPEIKRVKANMPILWTNEDKKSPKPPDKVLKTMAGKRPIRSAKKPKEIVPTTAPK